MHISIAGGLLLAASLVAAHGKIPNVTGDKGGAATAFGIQKDSANSENDVTIFKTGKFGATAKGAAIDPAKDLAAVQAIAGDLLPQVAALLNVTYHQVNGDGAGPLACALDTAAAGVFTTVLTIANNVPGNNGNSGAANEDFAVAVSIPSGTTCTGVLGTVKNVCLVQCKNPASAGPFGGVVPFQIASAAAGAGAAGGKKAGKRVAKVF